MQELLRRSSLLFFALCLCALQFALVFDPSACGPSKFVVKLLSCSRHACCVVFAVLLQVAQHDLRRLCCGLLVSCVSEILVYSGCRQLDSPAYAAHALQVVLQQRQTALISNSYILNKLQLLQHLPCD